MSASACVSTCPRVTVPLAVHRDRVGLVRSIVRFSSNRAAHPRGTRRVSGRHCATRVDEWSRAGRALVFLCVRRRRERAKEGRTRRRYRGGALDGRTDDARVAAPEGGDARGVCVCPRGGKLTNNESWIDDNHGDRVIDASRGVDVVGARAKRRARDVVATAGMRPRDAKRFVSSGRRERSRRDANVDVGDGAERRGPGPDRGRAGRAEELEEELEQVKPRHRRVEERERDERRG